MMITIHNVVEYCVFTPWVCWGLLPFLSVNLGFWLTALPLEYIVRQLGPDRSSFWSFHFIEYYNDDRVQALASVHSKIPFSRQVKEAFVQMCGKSAVIGAILARFLLPLVMPAPETTLPSLSQFVFQIIAMELIDDLALYWGHRIQHMNKYLWENFHYYHHQLLTPTAISAVVIHEHDAALQATLPMLLAAIFVRGHPIPFWIHLGYRVAQNTANHCGMESPLLDLVFWRFVPGRAKISHHDSHHRFSNYPGHAKNYGEMFVIWDRMFGTYSNTGRKSVP